MPPLLGGNHRRVYHVKVCRGKRINVCDANDVGKYNTLTLGLTISGVSEKPLQTPEWKSIVCRNVLVPLWMMTFSVIRCIKMKPRAIETESNSRQTNLHDLQILSAGAIFWSRS